MPAHPSSPLGQFQKALQEEIYGTTPGNCCVSCKQPFVLGKNVHTQSGLKETKISGLCEDCWDRMFSDCGDDL